MAELSKEQIRLFRLHTHHLDTWYPKADVERTTFLPTPTGA